MLALVLPAHRMGVAVNEIDGMGSTKMVMVESRNGQPG